MDKPWDPSMPEWQNPDSGYLRCIGYVSDNELRRRMEKIFNEMGPIMAKGQFLGPVESWNMSLEDVKRAQEERDWHENMRQR